MSDYEYLSECCGAHPKGNSDDMGICTECKDHCDYGYFDSDGNFFATEQEAIYNDLLNERDKLRID
jgi:hypothetical protein